MKHKVLLISLAVVFAIGVSLIGCAPDEEPEIPEHPEALIVSLARDTDEWLAIYDQMAAGPVYREFVDYVNNDLGGVHLKAYDTASWDCYVPLELDVREFSVVTWDIGDVTEAICDDINEGDVHFLWGGPGTDCIITQASIANSAGVVLLTLEGDATTIANDPTKLAKWPYVFITMSHSDWYQLPVLSAMLEAELGRTPKAYVVHIEGEHGDGYLATSEDNFDLVGDVVVGFTITQSEANTVIQNAIAALGDPADPNYDLFCGFAYPWVVEALTQASIDNNFNPPAMIFGPGANFGSYSANFCNENVEGIMSFTMAAYDAKAGITAVYDRVAERLTEEDPSGIGIPGILSLDYWGTPCYWAGLEMWLEAVESVGYVDQEKLRDALATYEDDPMETVMAYETWFRMYGTPGEGGGILDYLCHTGEIGQWQSGEFETVGYEGITDALPNYVVTGDLTFPMKDLWTWLQQPPPWEHSTLTTFYGSIRDDELAQYICDQIPKNAEGVPQVKDVTIMFNSCYGGGMLDDFQQVFGPGGACEGVPWVFGSASLWNEPAEGWPDIVIGAPKHAAKNLGSCWTDALAGKHTSTDDPSPGAIRDRTSDNVIKDLKAARDNDDSGPNHDDAEHPVVAWGNGGQNIEWDSSKKDVAVIFGGDNTGLRHDNNIENMAEALKIVWNNHFKYIGYGWGNKDTGTTEYLEDLIHEACSYLDSDTQLVLYFDDHGDTHFDLDEFLEWLLPYYIDHLIIIDFCLHAGWEEGLTAMYQQPGDEPSPFLSLMLDEPILSDDWCISLNEFEIPLPSRELTGELQLPVDWTSIQTGTNHLKISPTSELSGTMVLNNLELCSGPINEVEKANIGEEAVTFADPNLEASVRGAVAIPEGLIYPSDLEGLTSLSATESNIADLTGLEYCTNLETLFLMWNQISDISPLANLTSLTNLALENNQISDISPLANLTSLTMLGLGSNQISDISSVANLTNLTQLRLYSNHQISDISPLANLTNLTYLDLDYNQISDISPLVQNLGLDTGDEVYLSGNPLNSDSINIYIPQLEARGVRVFF